MVPPETFSLLFGFVLVLALGHGLRRAGRLGPEAAGTLNLIVTDVTLPALILATLSARPVPQGVLRAILTATVSLFAALSLGSLAGRALGLPRRAQGSVTLTSGFGNTGFLGIPFALGLFPGKPEAGTTAVLIDAFVSTPWLYTAGVFLARRYSEAADQGEAAGPAAPRLWRLLFTPPSIAVVLGLGMSVLGLHLPAWLARTAELLGGATVPLVFLALGLRLEFRSLAGRARPLLAVALIRLALVPLLVLGLSALTGLRGPVRQVAVLQAAMPSAMMSAVVADRYGCDGPLATGAVVLTMLLSVVGLPAWFALLQHLMGVGAS